MPAHAHAQTHIQSKSLVPKTPKTYDSFQMVKNLNIKITLETNYMRYNLIILA